MELKEGMYVRTLDGIMKVVELRDNSVMTRFRNEDGNIYFANDMMCNPSFNIIDLIEVGDYVNGYIVLDIIKDNLGKTYIECGCKDEIAHNYIYDTFYNEDIKSIVTKEQYESIKYSLEG